MSAFIPPTPDRDPDEEALAMIRESVREHDAQTARILDFCAAVQDMPGPLGEMFREVAHMFNEFKGAALCGWTTAAEETRVYGVVELSVAAWEWLRAGERP